MSFTKTANDLDNLENIIDYTEPIEEKKEYGEIELDVELIEQEPNEDIDGLEENYESDLNETDNETQIGGDPEDEGEQDGIGMVFEPEEESEEESEEEEELQKFDIESKEKYIIKNHPEIIQHNNEEIVLMSKIVRDSNKKVIDPLHKTIPFITKYERAKILGVRAKQINRDAPVFVNVPDGVIDGYTIAMIEYKAKKIPFIVRRPIPNGGCEYWKFEDLEQIDY